MKIESIGIRWVRTRAAGIGVCLFGVCKYGVRTSVWENLGVMFSLACPKLSYRRKNGPSWPKS